MQVLSDGELQLGLDASPSVHDIRVAQPNHVVSSEFQLRIVTDVAVAVSGTGVELPSIDLHDQSFPDEQVDVVPQQLHLLVKVDAPVSKPCCDHRLETRVGEPRSRGCKRP